MSKKEPLFKWGPISEKQLKLLTWWMPHSPHRNKPIIIAEGSIRSGKTIPMSLSFVEWAFSNFNDQLFGISGKTIGSLRQNVVAPLKKMLHGRGYRVDDQRATKLLHISKKGKTNTFELFGGKDEASQDLIQGRTLAGFLGDEVALQPESFINQAIARCSVDASKIWFNCNPDSPYHWFKTRFIDNIESLNAYYMHFTLDDNLTLSNEVKDRYRKLYTGVFYKRFIEGRWVLADGIIYDMWDRSKYMDDIIDKRNFKTFLVSVDYGTNNPCTFGLYGYDDDLPLYLVDEYWYDGSKVGVKQKTDAEYAEDFEKFLGDIVPDRIYVDPSALSFITALRRNPKYSEIIYKAKNDVLDGIRFVHSILHNKQYFVDKSCKYTDMGYSSYIWDQNAQKRGEDAPLKQNDHICDRDRYVIYSHFYNKFHPSNQQYYK